jgi:putative ABC transport system permease protein
MLGIGCFLAAHGVAELLARSDQQFANSDRIYALTQKLFTPGGNVAPPTMPFTAVKAAEYVDADFPELEAVSRLTLSYEGPVSYGDVKNFVKISHADAEFFQVFDWTFLFGDPATALRRDASVVLTQATATQLFGAPDKALGQTIIAFGRLPLTVTGVVKPLSGLSHLSATVPVANFGALISMDIFALSPMGKLLGDSWAAPGTFTYMLLPQDASLTAEQLQSRLESFDERHLPKDGWHSEFGAVPVGSILSVALNMALGSDQSGITMVGLLYVLGCLVLGVAAVNYANLAAAHGITRSKEIGLRRTLGAKRSAIALQCVCEAGLHVFVAATVAFVAALGIAGALRPAEVSALNFLADYAGSMLPLFGSVILAATLLSSAYPAFVLSRAPLLEALRSGRARGGRRLAPALLVSLQFAVTSFLLIAVLVMSAQFKNMESAALSAMGDPLVVVSNSTEASGVNFDSLREELLKQPHVRSVSAAMQPPWSFGGAVMSVSASREAAASRFTVCNNIVQRQYLETMGLQLIAGRDFKPEIASDRVVFTDLVGQGGTAHRYDGAAVIIDRALAEQHGWSPAQAIDKEIFLWIPGADSQSAPMARVIGVIENKSFRLVGLGATSNMYLFAPDAATLPVIRVDGQHWQIALQEIDTVWNRLAPNVTIKRQLGDEVLAGSIRVFVAITQAFKAVAILAVLIAVLGLVAMSIHIINRRMHEIGVRKTLGATVTQVLMLLLKDFSKPVVIANLIAWPVAFGAMSVFLSIFVTRTPLSFAPFVLSLLLTLMIAWGSVVIQALHAARLNPASVLRNE